MTVSLTEKLLAHSIRLFELCAGHPPVAVPAMLAHPHKERRSLPDGDNRSRRYRGDLALLPLRLERQYPG